MDEGLRALLRPELAELSSYVPADPPGIVARLDANEAPPFESSAVRDAVAAAIGRMPLERYPDARARELRAALAKHEQDLDDEREKCRARIEKNGNAADGMEKQLLDLTTRFCQPLRARPELAPLFKELETDEAVAAA